MPAGGTHADAIREYLTGAASDGGVQTNPDASLGNYRSSSEAQSLSMVITNAIAGLTIAYVGGGNVLGDGTLNAVDANTLRWKCAGDSYGASVPIANGQTMVLESSSGVQAFIRVTRTSAANLTGTATITLARAIDNVFSLDDASSAEAAAGSTKYRGTIIQNAGATSITSHTRWVGTLGTQQTSDVTQLGGSGAGTIATTGSFSTWPASGWAHIKTAGGADVEIVYYTSRTNTVLTVPAAGRARLGSSATAGGATNTVDAVPGIALAIDTAGVTAAGASIQTIANENTAPAAVSFNTGITSGTGLNIGTIGAGQQVGIWIKRELPVGAFSTAEADILINDSFSAA